MMPTAPPAVHRPGSRAERDFHRMAADGLDPSRRSTQMLTIVFTVLSLALIGVVLYDAFEVMVLPRRVIRKLRPARLYYHGCWALWRFVALRLPSGRPRQTFLGVFGPLSLLILFCLWVAGLITGFGLLHWSLAT